MLRLNTPSCLINFWTEWEKVSDIVIISECARFVVLSIKFLINSIRSISDVCFVTSDLTLEVSFA